MLREAMNRASDDLKLSPEIRNGLFRWVLNAVYMLIQVWAQMVRHNGTVAHLTCYNLGVVIKRHRDSQSMVVSQFLEYTDAPILRATALTVYAYTDSAERFDEQVRKGQSFWKDPYSGETMKEVAEDGDEDDDDDDGGDGNNQGPSGNKRDRGGGGRGGAGGNGAGGAGGGGSGGSGNGKGGGGGGNGKTGRDERAKNRAEGNAKRQAEEKARRRTDLEGVHLAFRASVHHLWSGGFSEFSRLNPTAAALAGPAPHSAQDDGLSSPALEAMYGLTASDQQRRVSAGSTHSSGSATSIRTNAPSLFDERASSSVPTSPATTANFSDSAQSRGGSPFPEKAAGHQMGSSGPTSATISHAGILLHDILGQSAIGIVWSGKMILEDGSNEDTSIPIAVKMAVPRDNGESEATDDEREIIRQEGAVYDFLAKSGKQDISPRCYGVFEDEVGTVALILDNGGEALESFHDLRTEQ
ncbi:hypothetical protein DFH06DRAFT_597863 [Mycena polygramma]|nr:hypothetical protein DFH06DRAFT_597863 [Mycena polygramma]